MKKLLIVAMLLVAAGLSAQEWQETPFGSVRFERAVFRGNSSYRVVNIIVQYRNTTDNTFTNVTLNATVYDDDERVIGTNTRSWFDFSDGPIRPGFSGVKEIPIDITGLPQPAHKSIGVTARQ